MGFFSSSALSDHSKISVANGRFAANFLSLLVHFDVFLGISVHFTELETPESISRKYLIMSCYLVMSALTNEAIYQIQTLLAQPVFFAATLRNSSGNLASNSKPILAEALAIRLKNSKN